MVYVHSELHIISSRGGKLCLLVHVSGNLLGSSARVIKGETMKKTLALSLLILLVGCTPALDDFLAADTTPNVIDVDDYSPQANTTL